VRAFEAGFEIDAGVIGAVLSRQIDDLEPRLTRNGYDKRSLVEQFGARPAETRQLLRGDLDPDRSQELLDQMRGRAADVIRLNHRAPGRIVSRPSQWSCVQSPTACVRQPPQSQSMCAGNSL